MVTRMSLVKLRDDIERGRAVELWLGAHADVVRSMPQVERYAIAVAEHPRASDQWDAVATLAFRDREAMVAALEDPDRQRELLETRIPFVERVEAFVVEEHVVIDGGVVR